MNLDALWTDTLAELQLQMTKATFNTWFIGTRATAVAEDGTLTIQVRSDYAKDWLESRLHETTLRTTRAVQAIDSFDIETEIKALRFVVRVDDSPARPPVKTYLPESHETAVANQAAFPGFEPFRSNFVQTPKQFFEVVLREGPYVMRIFVGLVIANTYGRILNFRTMERAEWWEANRAEIGRETGIKSPASIDRAIREARLRGYVIRENGAKTYKYRPREEREPVDYP